jgi:hypothetical protein
MHCTYTDKNTLLASAAAVGVGDNFFGYHQGAMQGQQRSTKGWEQHHSSCCTVATVNLLTGNSGGRVESLPTSFGKA